MAALPPTLSKGGQRCLFHNSIIGNFIYYLDQIGTNLLQPFMYPENSVSFSISSVIICEINIVAVQKQTYWYQFLFLQVSNCF